MEMQGNRVQCNKEWWGLWQTRKYVPYLESFKSNIKKNLYDPDKAHLGIKMSCQLGAPDVDCPLEWLYSGTCSLPLG